MIEFLTICITYIFYFPKKTKCFIAAFLDNLKSRYKVHLEGFVKATKHRRPLKLVYYEAYVLETDVKRREKYLKGGNNRASLKIQLSTVLTRLDYVYF